MSRKPKEDKHDKVSGDRVERRSRAVVGWGRGEVSRTPEGRYSECH